MNVSETLKALAKSGTVTSKAAAGLIEEMLSERETMQVEIDALELARDDLTARVEAAHKAIAAANASEVLPPTDAIRLAVLVENERCAKLCEIIEVSPHPEELCAMNAWEALKWGRAVAAGKIRGSPPPVNATKLPPAGTKG